jgi:hypothetical protein
MSYKLVLKLIYYNSLVLLFQELLNYFIFLIMIFYVYFYYLNTGGPILFGQFFILTPYIKDDKILGLKIKNFY